MIIFFEYQTYPQNIAASGFGDEPVQGFPAKVLFSTRNASHRTLPQTLEVRTEYRTEPVAVAGSTSASWEFQVWIFYINASNVFYDLKIMI